MSMSLTMMVAMATLAVALEAQPKDAPSGDLLSRIWDGVQQAQNKYASACGKITETRTSKLLVKPLVFHGKFCAEGLLRFSLEYSDPDPIRIVFNQDYLNVTTGKRTEVLDVGENVRRTQSYFTKGNSLENLKKNFAVDAREDNQEYLLTLVPHSGRFSSALNYVSVRLGKQDFLLRSLEVDGKSGVNSQFQISVTSVNTKIPPGTFDVYRPK
jgi:outer membrane lipoprotein-sorting protein